MAITIRATSTDGNPNGTSITISLPAGTTSGDVTVAYVTSVNEAATFAAAGWSLIGSVGGMSAFYRVFQGGDPASVTFNATASAFLAGAMVTYIGCDTSAPLDGVNTATINFFGNVTAASVLAFTPEFVTKFQNGLQVAVFGAPNNSGATFTTPGGFTARVSVNPGPSIAVFDQTFTSGGYMAMVTSAISTSTIERTGISFALKASGAAAVSSPPSICALSGLATGGGQTRFTPTNGSAGAMFIDLTFLNPQVGDLVVAFVASATSVTGPQAMNLALSGTGYGIYAKTFNAGDSPVISMVALAGQVVAPTFSLFGVALFRGLNTTKYASVAGVSAAGATVTNPSTGITAPSLVPPTANDALLLYYWEVSNSAESTWTAPAGTTKLCSSGIGPSDLFCYMNPTPNPSNTRTATGALVSVTAATGVSLDITLSTNPTIGGFVIPVPFATELKGGTTGTAYSETISAASGTSPYTFAVTAGSLPTSLSLNGSSGIISGTPTVAGTYPFTITATDAHGFTGAQAFSITIATPSAGGAGNYGFVA